MPVGATAADRRGSRESAGQIRVCAIQWTGCWWDGPVPVRYGSCVGGLVLCMVLDEFVCVDGVIFVLDELDGVVFVLDALDEFVCVDGVVLLYGRCMLSCDSRCSGWCHMSSGLA